MDNENYNDLIVTALSTGNNFTITKPDKAQPWQVAWLSKSAKQCVFMMNVDGKDKVIK